MIVIIHFLFYLLTVVISWVLFSNKSALSLLVNLLSISLSALSPALVSEVGGISEETVACDWWSLGAILFELLTGTVSQKVQKKKMLSLLLRCYGMSVGVLAFNSLSLFMVVPGCVWFCARVCVCLSRWSLLFAVCMYVWGASWLPSHTLVLGECQGCRCDFLPQPELHLLGQGVSSPRASLLAPGAALGFERADPRSAWKVKTGAALKVLELGWSRIRAVWGTIF